MTEDRSIFAHIDELVAEEHALRAKLTAGEISRDEERERLAELEVDLDRCWDLLRQRRAKREFGENPDEASERPGGTVENYLG
jgi:predicted nuclease with TOPRIM domain